MPNLQSITLNKVIYGVTRKLGTTFPEARIYVEETPQELDPPAFFIKLLNPVQTQEIGPRYRRYHPFDIHYFAPGFKNTDYHAMADQLYNHLRLIEIDGKLYRGTSMNHEVIDRVLHFFVDYNFMVKDLKEDETKMQKLEYGGVTIE